MKTPLSPAEFPVASAWRLFAAFCAAALPAFSASERPPEAALVIVNVDLTPEGRKVSRPSPDKPAYYVPVILGYQEAGKIIGGEKPPSRQEMIRQLGRALQKQGYVLQAVRPDANRTLPSLILAFEWGYLNPDVTNFGVMDLTTGEGGTLAPSEVQSTSPMAGGTANYNQAAMVTLVAGSALTAQISAVGSAALSQTDWERIRNAVTEDRYFIIVSAYDFAASLKGEQRLLWRARMSTERHGVWMDDVLPALVAAGAPVFGRETGPQFNAVPVSPGTVKLAPLEIKDAAVGPTEEKSPTERRP